MASLGASSSMAKRKRTTHHKMTHLRSWRESLGLSRQAVANKIGTIRSDLITLDQATIAKWESGETAVKVEDLELLAQVYGVSADRLFFPPGDRETPELIKSALKILTTKNPEAVRQWLALGENLAAKSDLPN